VVQMLGRCGKTEKDDSTAHDRPRPPLVTRWLDYKKAHVRFEFLANGRVGDPPPYTWKYLGAIDPRTKKVLDRTEIHKRLPCWN
jgi:hypothetical protein